MPDQDFNVRLSILETEFKMYNDKLNTHTELLNKIVDSINGNGKPGLKEIIKSKVSYKVLWIAIVFIIGSFGTSALWTWAEVRDAPKRRAKIECLERNIEKILNRLPEK